ncbi:DNA polymerase III subunit epsilon [Mesorhizobium sp. L-8-3]|uniref:DNA polymerase III subunit epsilon n=1 Tax=Mesorhizobium sp. L-8-3 TaxID=2744522 RepID=UPI001926FB7C|nr:DNA polymerase III subunit epsilon [Mesorhizobium sp. L-8-3]BCH21343.1 hypothetical protein MesoLjLb_11280 [Mesorhizobium sp. L-8-3]
MTGSQPTYVVTDIEADGPDPQSNSMLSFASVAVDGSAAIVGEFEAVLAPRPDRSHNLETTAWWAGYPEAFRAATTDPRPAEAEMRRFAGWVEGLPGPRVFVARPLIFDGAWIDEYLKSFLGIRLLSSPFPGPKLFDGPGIDLPSFMGGLFGWPYGDWLKNDFPPDWLGHVEHTHRAIDDARGYANILSRLLSIAATQSRKPEDFRRIA